MGACRDTGIMLLAFGGPSSLEEVEPFLQNVFSGAPLSPLLVDQVRERYRLIGGKSPLLEITKRQAYALQVRLCNVQHPIAVYVGMRHWHPHIRDTLKLLAGKGVNRVLCFIMVPFATKATVAGYQADVGKGIRDGANTIKVDYVPSWHVNPFYLEAVAAKVKEGLALFPSPRQEQVTMVFTAHSLPLTVVKDDPYVDQIKTTIALVMQHFKGHDWCLAFQSQGKRGDAWLSPTVEAVLDSMAKSDKREILLTPLGFVADHLETLYDLDIVLAEKAGELGLELHRSPSLNDSAKFIDALAHIAITSLDTIAP